MQQYLADICGCGEDNKTSEISDVSTLEESVSSDTNQDIENGHTIHQVQEFSDGYAWVTVIDTQIGSSDNTRTLCINPSGEIQFFLDEKIEGTTFYTRKFENGFSVVSNENDEEFIISTTGEVLLSSIDGTFDKVLAYGDGYFAVEKYINDFHTAEYKAFVIDQQGNMIGDYFLSQPDRFDEYDIDYLKEAMFSYKGDSTKFFNAKTGSVFEIDPNYILGDIFGEFSNGVCLIQLKNVNEEKYKPTLLYSDGTFEVCEINPPYDLRFGGISDSGFLYLTTESDKTENLNFFDLSTKTSNVVYSCGEGIRFPKDLYELLTSEVFGFDNGYSVVLIEGNDASYFTVIDKLGSFQFEPIECIDARAISCNRIISRQMNSYKIFNEKGEEIPIADGYVIHQKSYSDNLIAVHREVDGDWCDYNYIGSDGNLLFENNLIYY